MNVAGAYGGGKDVLVGSLLLSFKQLACTERSPEVAGARRLANLKWKQVAFSTAPSTLFLYFFERTLDEFRFSFVSISPLLLLRAL